MLTSTEMARFIAQKFADNEFHTTKEAKAEVAELLTEEERKMNETNRHTGEPTGKLKWEHDFHSGLSKLLQWERLVRGKKWGTFKIINGSASTPPCSSSDGAVALLAEVSALAAKVGGIARLKQIVEMMGT